jgi:hypothetical protein
MQSAVAETFFSVESWQLQLAAEAFFVSDRVETREATEVEAFLFFDSVKTMEASEAEPFFSVETWQQQLKLKPSLFLI